MNIKTFFVSIAAGVLMSLPGAEAIFSGKTITLSNDRIKAVIDLSKGARLSSFFDKKKGIEWTKIMKSPGGSGLLGDSFRNPLNHAVDSSYRNKLYKQTSARIGETVTITVCSPAGQQLDIEKTFKITDNSDKLEVHYVITNPGDKDVISTFWGSNAFQVPGEKKYVVHFPDGRASSNWRPEGPVKQNRYIYDTTAGKSADIFVYDANRNYAAVGTDKGNAVIEVPFQYLNFFYTWQNPNPDGFAITDWFSTAFQLQPLSKGKAEAVLHSVLKDPLEKYKYQFTVTLRLPETFNYDSYGKINPCAKSEAFTPRLGEDRSYTEFNTPAIIRNPAPLKKLKVLSFSCAHANAEMNELKRRLSLDLTMVETSNLDAFGPTPYFGWQIPIPADYLKKALKKEYDIILVCGHSDKNIPKDLIAAMRKKIEKGTAFIYVGDRNVFQSIVPKEKGREIAPSAFAGTLAERLPSFGKIREYTLGKGKVIFLNFPMAVSRTRWVQESRAVIPHVSKDWKDFPYWEYYFSFYGKLFRYAAGAKTQAQIVSATADEAKIIVRINAEQALDGVQIGASADTPLCRTVPKICWKGALKKGENKITLPLPAVTADGGYIVHLQLSTLQNTLDWFDTAYDHRSANRIEKVECARIQEDGKAPVAVSVQIAGKGDLELSLTESATGRVAALRKIAGASGKVDCSLKREFSTSLKHYTLTAALKDKEGKILSLVKHSVLIRPLQPNPERIRPLIWGAHMESWRDRLFNAEMAECGFVNYKAPFAFTKPEEAFQTEAESVTRSGMEYMPLGVEHIHGGFKANAPTVRTPCIRSPQYIERLDKRSRIIGKRSKSAMVDGVFVSDEMTLGANWNSPHDFCTSPWCMAAFREMLKKKYSGDLEKLNRNWKSSFASWDQVKPDTLRAARQKKHFASWIEHRVFMMDAMTGAFRKIHDVIKETCGAELGVSGMRMSQIYSGYDMMASTPFLKNSSNYDAPSPFTADALRSSMTREHSTGSYTDYGPRFSVWTQLINGLVMPSVWWYGHLIRRGDARLSEEGVHLQKMFGDIRNSGASCILGYGKRRKSPVTLIYSVSSMIAAEAGAQQGGINGLDYIENLNSWARLVRDLGLDAVNVLTDDKIAELTPAKNPIVILPLVLVLSDADVAALEKYVAAGGTLIADLDTGKYDGFCVERKDKGLYPLLGVKTAPGMAIGPSGKLKIGKYSPGNVFFGGSLTLEKESKAQGAIGIGSKGANFGGIVLKPAFHVKAPACIARKYGRGRTLYMNFAMPEYGKGECSRPNRRNIMVSALRPLLDIPGTVQNLPVNSTYAAYELDGIDYRFLGRSPGESDGKFELVFPGKAHLYEMISGKYCGYASSLKDTIGEREVKIFGAFPEKPAPLTGKITFDGRVFRIQADRRNRCFTPVRLQVFHDGKELIALGKTLRMKKSLKDRVDLGIVPPAGKWQVVLASPADGSRLEKTVTISGENKK